MYNFEGFVLFALVITGFDASSRASDVLVASDTLRPMRISQGGDAGEYQAFPDACRLKSGDIVAVFYAGDEHVTKPSEKYSEPRKLKLLSLN